MSCWPFAMWWAYAEFSTKYDHPDPSSGSLIWRFFNLSLKLASTATNCAYIHLEEIFSHMYHTR